LCAHQKSSILLLPLTAIPCWLNNGPHCARCLYLKYSSKRMGRKALATIPGARLERFLRELANLKIDNSSAITRFLRQFGDMLEDLPSAQEWCEGPPGFRHPDGQLRYRSPGFEEEMRIGALSVRVISIWRGSTPREKQFRTLLLHRAISAWKPTFLLAPEVVKDLSTPGPFEQAILHLLNSADRALVCRNPDCPAPLFFRRRTNRRQTYCSTECSGFGQKTAKQKWWAEHGQQWREKHQNKK